MARGPGKVKILEEQIAAKEETVGKLEKQLEEEKETLKALQQAKATQEIEKLYQFLAVSNLTPGQAIEILAEYTNRSPEGAD